MIVQELKSFAQFFRWLSPTRRRYVARTLAIAAAHDLAVFFVLQPADRVEAWRVRTDAHLNGRDEQQSAWRREFNLEVSL